MRRTVSLNTGARLAALAAVVVPLGCASEGRYFAYDESNPVDSPARVVTFVDFFEGGRKAVGDYLRSLPEAERIEIEAALERASAACARLGIVVDRRGMDYSLVSGSAVLVRPAGQKTVRIATAGHTFGAPDPYDVRVTLSDGRRIATRSVEARFEQFASASDDWAVMEIESGGEGLPAIPFRRPQLGELAFVLSYPNQMGVNEDGFVVYGHEYGDAPLTPIVTVATVTDTSPLRLDPVAGTLGMGGASGGAIVNRAGELIGVLSGSGWVPMRRGAEYWIRGATVEAFADRLTAEPKTGRD